MNATILRQNTKKFAAASLIFWLSGVLFLFCCETAQAQATETESCPLAKTRHCSKQSDSEKVSQSASVQSETQTLNCCRFLPQIFNKAWKIEKTEKVESAVAGVEVLQPKFSIVKREFPLPKTFRSIVLNRENTHLKNCVFRI